MKLEAIVNAIAAYEAKPGLRGRYLAERVRLYQTARNVVRVRQKLEELSRGVDIFNNGDIGN
jgi:hypothetical protein